MRNIEFQLLNDIKYLISSGKTLNEVSTILNLDLNYIKYLCKKIKTDIIQSSNCEEFYLIPRIDTLLNKKYKRYNKFPYQHEYIIIDMLHLSDQEIIERLNINMPRYLSFLRAMYYMLYVYNIDGVDKSYLGVIKDRIDNIENITRSHKYIYSIEEYNDTSVVEFPNCKKNIDIPHGKVFDFGNKDIRFIVISDMHFGAWYENVDYLKQVYEYASKNNIRFIVNTGDLIEGNCFNYDRCKEEYKNINAQVEHVFYNYCYDENIDNIILLGNHDFTAYVKEGKDIIESLKIRDDFKILGYKEAYLKLRDEVITLKHEVSKIITAIDNPCSFLNLVGHSHQYRCMYDDDIITMKVPCLCDIYSGPSYVVNKGFVVCDIHFDSDGLYNVETEYIRFDKNDSIKFERRFK